MNMPDAVRSVLTQYATFSGRARRSEYWYFVLAYFIASIIAAIIDGILGTSGTFGSTGLIGGILTLALLIPSLAVAIRRLHDINKSGWWVLLGLIPLIGAIILIVWFCGDSKPDNQYGPNPKGAGAGGGYGAPGGYGHPPAPGGYGTPPAPGGYDAPPSGYGNTPPPPPQG